MSVEKSEKELSQMLSTYGVITAERIFGRYQIKLGQNDLMEAIKCPFSFYHRLLQVPLKNVFTGIILQQAHDYHVYAQKLFIDYLLSGENAKGEEEQGAITRESLEEERQQLVTLGEEYNEKERMHNQIISTSQNQLIKITQKFNLALEVSIKKANVTLSRVGDVKGKMRQAIIHALIYCDLKDPQLQSNEFLFTEKLNEVLKIALTQELKTQLMKDLSGVLEIVLNFDDKMRPFTEQCEEMNTEALSFREQFYNTVLRVIDLLNLLPEYKINQAQDAANRESLYFDRSIGALT